MSKEKTLGVILMTVGVLLVCAALGLFLSNQRESERAGEASELVLPQIIEHIELADVPLDEPLAVYESDEMTEGMIDGYAYIGYLSVPSLNLELPIMSEWNYPQLRIAPCRYTGSTMTNDLVICGHNYERHFGNLKNMTIGDVVIFTDMDGVTIRYQVVSVETLEPTAVETMTNSDYDLTLFTCTYGGASRVTVRCNRAA